MQPEPLERDYKYDFVKHSSYHYTARDNTTIRSSYRTNFPRDRSSRKKSYGFRTTLRSSSGGESTNRFFGDKSASNLLSRPDGVLFIFHNVKRVQSDHET